MSDTNKLAADVLVYIAKHPGKILNHAYIASSLSVARVEVDDMIRRLQTDGIIIGKGQP